MSVATRRLIVLGSTGSIGQNTLEVVQHLNQLPTRHGEPAFHYEVVGLAARSDAATLVSQARSHGVQTLAIADERAAERLATHLPEATLLTGPDAALQLVEETQATDVAAAIVGVAGLPATLAALRLGRRVHLSNKETLVAAGPLVQPLLAQHGGSLLPVDSEHSAIFQCLADRPVAEVRRLILTASGGPFRTRSAADIYHATLDDALNHPTWTMGPKVTLDSATLMNKALEIIEAHWLFGVPAEQIDVLIHPQSLVHGLVEFHDGSTLAQLGPPDMRTPIQHALTHPHHVQTCGPTLDWATLKHLDFDKPDPARFPALALAYAAIERGGTAGATLNAANEAAVEAFLAARIPFGRIVELVQSACDALPASPLQTLADIDAATAAARDHVQAAL